jgi:hypothetical protein
MPAVLRPLLLLLAISFSAAGLYLIVAGESHSSTPRTPPRTPAASIGPDGAKPAWRHVCPGENNDPKWCEDI